MGILYDGTGLRKAARSVPAITGGVNVLLASVVIAPANPERLGMIIFNNSSNSVYVTFGATSASSTCTRLIPTFASWECLGSVIYTGVVSAIRNAGSGACIAYELLP